MPCRPISVNLEVDPSTTQQILFTLGKTCDAHDQATWKLSFTLKEGNPLSTVVALTVEIDPVNHPQAEATAAGGLDANQQGQAQIAAAVVKDNTVSQADKKAAVQQVVAVRAMPPLEAGQGN
jgi:hypothetical protein